MDIIKFVEYFNLIKPSFQEIEKSTASISTDIAIEISNDFDLKITSMNLYEDLIIDLIENTNISETTFSVFHFYKGETQKRISKIGMIEEKGNVFFNKDEKYITFEEIDINQSNQYPQPINQIEFLSFLLKYLELYFNMIFRKNVKDFPIIDAIQIDIETVKKFPVFKELLYQLGIELESL